MVLQVASLFRAGAGRKQERGAGCGALPNEQVPLVLVGCPFVSGSPAAAAAAAPAAAVASSSSSSSSSCGLVLLLTPPWRMFLARVDVVVPQPGMFGVSCHRARSISWCFCSSGQRPFDCLPYIGKCECAGCMSARFTVTFSHAHDSKSACDCSSHGPSSPVRRRYDCS